MKTLTITSALALSLLASACADVDGSFGSSEDSISARPSFDVFEGTDGRTFFHLNAANHEIILASQGYKTRTGALAGVLSVLDNGGTETAFQLNPANGGGYYFNLVAANNQVIGTSEVYSTKSNAKGGIKTVMRNIGDYLAFTAGRTGARFVVFENESGSFFYQLRAKNGQIVLRSQAYSTEAAALNATFSVSDNGTSTERFDILASADGGFYLNLKAANGEIIGTSQVYSTKSNATRGRNAIIALLPDVDLL